MLHWGKIIAGSELLGYMFTLLYLLVCGVFFFYGNKIIDAGLGHSVYMQKKMEIG